MFELILKCAQLIANQKPGHLVSTNKRTEKSLISKENREITDIQKERIKQKIKSVHRGYQN